MVGLRGFVDYLLLFCGLFCLGVCGAVRFGAGCWFVRLFWLCLPVSCSVVGLCLLSGFVVCYLVTCLLFSLLDSLWLVWVCFLCVLG